MRLWVVAVLLATVLAALVYAENEISGYDEVRARELHCTAESTLTDNSASNIITIPLADGELAGGVILGTVHCTDGTDHQALTTVCYWSAVRKGGTVTADVASASTLDTTAVSAGTLVTSGGANGWTVTTDGTSATIKLTANTSLTPTVMHYHFVAINGHDSELTFP